MFEAKNNELLLALEKWAHACPNKACFTYVEEGANEKSYTYAQVLRHVKALAESFYDKKPVEKVFLPTNMQNCPRFVFVMLACAYAKYIFVPLNSRLTKEECTARIQELPEDKTNVSANVVLFTSGSTSKPKAASITWENLCASANTANKTLNVSHTSVFQLALPMFHVGGMQVAIRSILAGATFILYKRFNAAKILEDAKKHGATHISVVDKMLQDMLSASTAHGRAIQAYKCILLGGGALNPKTLKCVQAAGANVWASYGMSETSSQIANAQITAEFDGELNVMQGVNARIFDANENGFGSLGVAGACVVSGYINAAATFRNGYFITGDTAKIDKRGKLYIKERTKDMFVSGGENVSPAEIKSALLEISWVQDAYVFGTKDEAWGMRPVAFVESARTAGVIKEELKAHLSKLYMPKHLFSLNKLPRIGIGKVDGMSCKKMFDNAIDGSSINLYCADIPFKKPFKTAKKTLHSRKVLLVEVRDRCGRRGIGECSAFETNWYLPETIEQSKTAIENIIAPKILQNAFLRPRQAYEMFLQLGVLDETPMAYSAVEVALWDLYGKIVKQPLWQLIGGCETKPVYTASVIPLGSPREVLQNVNAAVGTGAKRVKLKVKPDSAYACASAVRNAHENLQISLDANMSFSETNFNELQKLDNLNIAWVEEPLKPSANVKAGSEAFFKQLSLLQKQIKTPICLDESITNKSSLQRALKHENLKCYALKVGKFGGICASLDFLKTAYEKGLCVWTSGMYDTGIMRRVSAAFNKLEQLEFPGDISAPESYLAHDVAVPKYDTLNGTILLDASKYKYGIGCELDIKAAQKVL